MKKKNSKNILKATLIFIISTKLLVTICGHAAFGGLLVVVSSNSQRENSQNSVQEIYEAVAGTKNMAIDKFRATFKKDGESWTIVGAHAPIVSKINRPQEWPIKGRSLEVEVLSKPISNKKILPWTEIIEDVGSNQILQLRGCPGEYEAASFVLRSGDHDVKNILIYVPCLIGESSVIGNENVDIRVVKCWYQADTELWTKEKWSKILTPELLLKDDGIIQVNHEYQVNLIKNINNVKDSIKLIPFDLPKQENKQIWITLHIPDAAPSGSYKGKLLIKADNMPTKELAMHVDVLPFTLEDPIINYSMFYDASLLDGKPESQMFLELQDMRQHGVYNPIITMKSFNPEKLSKTLDLREKAGISNDVIYYVAWPILKDDSTYMQNIITHCRDVVNYFKARDVKEVYFYGFDELSGTRLQRAEPFYKIFQAIGAKTFVAGASDFFVALGSSIDLPIIWGQGGRIKHELLQSLVSQAHKAGKRIGIYSFPQCGKEEPETYRRNFGLFLWKFKVDMACNYAYQAVMHHPWDDFDFPSFPAWRDEVMTYPTATGFIPTIQWEGWREGVKDVKYVSTLMKIKNQTTNVALRDRIEHELALIDINGDLDIIRDKLINLIVKCLF